MKFGRKICIIFKLGNEKLKVYEIIVFFLRNF